MNTDRRHSIIYSGLRRWQFWLLAIGTGLASIAAAYAFDIAIDALAEIIAWASVQ
jgi:hypothetical protein